MVGAGCNIAEGGMSPKLRNLTDDERRKVHDVLLTKLKNGQPEKGAFAEVASSFNGFDIRLRAANPQTALT